MHSPNARYHSLGCAVGTVDRHHGGDPCPAQPQIGFKRVVCSHTQPLQSLNCLLGPEYFTRRNPAKTAAVAARLSNRIRNLGFDVQIKAAA
jgi:hypothetical protein